MFMFKRIVIPVVFIFILMSLTGAVSAQQKGKKGAKGPKGGKKGGPGWDLVILDDENGDRKISEDEFSGPPSVFPRLDKNGDGFLTEDEVPKTPPGAKKGRPRREDKGPKAGTVAPVFTLHSLDGKEEFNLASYRGKKPVILFFGSYT